MFSPSDYNDAVPQFSNGNYANEPLNPLYVEEPDDVNYKRGAEPLQTLPVQWWNWLWNKITAKLNNLNIYVKNIFNELAGLLSLVNVTPNATEEKVTTGQLKDMFATKYPQYLYDNFESEVLFQGRTRGVMVAPTDTWNDTTNKLSLTGGFGIINNQKVTFSDCDLVIPDNNSVHFIVSDTSGVISIQNSIEDNVILIGLCRTKEYCLLIDNNPDQCKDNIILKKWFGQHNISQDFVPVLQSYYDTAIASIETKISIETVSGFGFSGSTLNNCTISIKTVNSGGNCFSRSTLNNCTITIETVSGGNGFSRSTLNNCIITIETVSRGNGVISGTFNNCTITFKTVSGGYGINNGAFNNCTITIKTVSGGYGISKGTFDNCTITFETVSRGNGVISGTFNNCTITFKTVSGTGVSDGAFNNCTITFETVNSGGTGVSKGTFDNCTITFETVNSTCVYNGTFDNCTITFKTVSDGYSINNGAFNNCTITFETVNSGGTGVYNGTFDNCTITFKTVNSGGTGVSNGAFNNCTITIETVSGGYGISKGTFDNCTITIKTVSSGTGINNYATVVLYLTYIKCSEITSLSDTSGKLNVLNDTVFHAS